MGLFDMNCNNSPEVERAEQTTSLCFYGCFAPESTPFADFVLRKGLKWWKEN